MVSLLKATAHDEWPLPADPTFRPRARGRRYGFAHYNFVVPSLPEPHRFMACAVMIGQTGTRAFDVDHALRDGPRRTATVANGTAATAPGWFAAYSTERDCMLADDGSELVFGDELRVTGAYPAYRLVARRPRFAAELELELTDEVTWFARSPIYDHLGIPARYTGHLTWNGRRVAVDTIGTFEHAQAVSPSVLVNRPLPGSLKLPWDFFTYQVIALGPDTLLLLTYTLAFGRRLLATAFVKQLGGDQLRLTRDVHVEISGPSPEREALDAPDGRTTDLPASFVWTIGAREKPLLELETVPDTEMIYGIGSGWIGGLVCRGRYRGAEVRARGYCEYIDRR